jgi:O-antigen/teichoic acid export membrane protein
MEEKRDDGYGHILKYTGIFGGVQGLNILIGLVRNKIVASLLGPSGVGLVSLFNSAVNFISQSTNLGISFSSIRNISEFFDSGDEARVAHFVMVVRLWSLLTAIFGMAVCVVAGPVLSDYTFAWGDHTLHFVLLSPAVGLLAIAGGEMAVLKGCRRLGSLAMIQVVNVVLSLIITVPLYYLFNQSAIVPVIVLTTLISTLTTIFYSYRLYPLRLSGYRGLLGEGAGMVRLGMAFVLAGILGSGAEILVRSYLNVTGELQTVGFYNVGFVLTVTYAGMVFSAMETDYFPRLSAVGDNREAMCQMVNRQIEVSLLLVSPLLTLLMVLMPILIPLLFTRDFMPVVPMAQVAVFAMYFKAVSLPIAYLQLARANSLGYLLLEAAFDILMVVLVIVGYQLWSLLGTGVALSVSYLMDVLMVYVYAHVKYGYRMSAGVLRLVAVLFPLGMAVYIVTLLDNSLVYWTMGMLLSFLSMALSLYILHQKTHLWNALKERFLSKLHRHG